MLLEEVAPGRAATIIDSLKLRPQGMYPADMAVFLSEILEAVGMELVRGELPEALARGQPFIAVIDATHAVLVHGVREVGGFEYAVIRDPLEGAYLRESLSWTHASTATPRFLSIPRCGQSDLENDLSPWRATMNQATVAKMISRYESGVVTAAEVANWLLGNLLDETELDLPFLSSIGSLPDEVRQRFVDLLGEIREAGYHWSPFLITADPNRNELADYPQKLRQVCSLVEDSWTPTKSVQSVW
jgi:hypothetical protein